MTHTVPVSAANPLQEIQAKRRNAGWEPLAPSVSPMRPAHEVLKRVLSLRFLESDVEEWILNASREVPEDVKPYLLRNAQDEHRHDVVMSHLADYYGHTEEANDVVAAWRSLEAHPIVKACALEAGVFFIALPMLRSYGQGDLYADWVRQMILDDESCHVATNRTLMKRLGLRLPRKVMQLVQDTVGYLVEPVPGVADKWLKRSQQTLVSGRSDDFDEETSISLPDPFTQRTRQSIVYYS